MKRLKVVALAGLIAALCLALAGCQSQEYTPEAKAQTVPASALVQDGTLRVGVNASSAPLAGKTSSSSRIVGIDVDVAAYLADELGLKVEIVDVGTEFASALSDGKVDVVLGVDSSDDASGYWRSTPYLDTGVALFGASTETAVPTTDSTPKVAAQASSKSSWRVTNLFGDSALVSQTELKAAFEALASGSARYVAADAVIGTYVSHSSGYSDKVVALLQDPSGYCAAASESNTALQSAISSAVSKLVSGGAMGIIEDKWLGQTLDLSGVTVIKGASGDKAGAPAAAAPAAEEAEGEAAEGRGDVIEEEPEPAEVEDEQAA